MTGEDDFEFHPEQEYFDEANVAPWWISGAIVAIAFASGLLMWWAA